jgi:positive regulator of sigma E activity
MIRTNKRAKVNLSKLGELRETRLLRWAGLVFMLPNLILGISALFQPYLYMLVPVYETA